MKSIKQAILNVTLIASLFSLSVEGLEGKKIAATYKGSKITGELAPSAEFFSEILINNDFKESLDLTTLAQEMLINEKSPHQSTDSIFKVRQNFTAMTLSNAPQTSVIPLNPIGAVGEKQYILMTYQSLRSFDRKTGKPDQVLDTDASSFFGCSANDVRIDYDRFSKRWFASCEETLPSGLTSSIFLAVSNGSVITKQTRWDIYQFPSSIVAPNIAPANFAGLDYSQLAVDQYNVYINVDVFSLDGSVGGSNALVISKSLLFAETPPLPPIVTVFSILPVGNTPTIDTFSETSFSEFTPPADNFDINPRFGYYANAGTNQYPTVNTVTGDPQLGITFDFISFYRVIKPSSLTPSLTDEIVVQVPPYTPAQNAPHKGNLYTYSYGFTDLEQVAGNLQTSIFSGLVATHVRNKQLYACHNIQVNSDGEGDPNGDRVGVRWYQFDLTGDRHGKGNGHETAYTTPALVQYGTLYDPNPATSSPKFYFNPSIMTNKRHDLVIEATVSSVTEYTNVVVAARKKRDDKGTLRSPIYLTHNTSNPYNYGPLLNPSNANLGQRWGDESSLNPDPVHDLNIWSTGQWAAVNNGYGIRATELKPVK